MINGYQDRKGHTVKGYYISFLPRDRLAPTTIMSRSFFANPGSRFLLGRSD